MNYIHVIVKHFDEQSEVIAAYQHSAVARLAIEDLRSALSYNDDCYYTLHTVNLED